MMIEKMKKWKKSLKKKREKKVQAALLSEYLMLRSEDLKLKIVFRASGSTWGGFFRGFFNFRKNEKIESSPDKEEQSSAGFIDSLIQNVLNAKCFRVSLHQLVLMVKDR